MDNEKLNGMIKEFYDCFNRAQQLRRAVLDYIEETLDIDANENYEYFEDDSDFCFGFDLETIDALENGDEDLINELRNS